MKISHVNLAALGLALAFTMSAGDKAHATPVDPCISASGSLTTYDGASCAGAPAEPEWKVNLDATGKDGTKLGSGVLFDPDDHPTTVKAHFATNVNADYANGFANIKPVKGAIIKTLEFTLDPGYGFTDLLFGSQLEKLATLNIEGFFGDNSKGSITLVNKNKSDNHIGLFSSVVLTKVVFTALLDGKGAADEFKQFEVSNLCKLGVDENCFEGGSGHPGPNEVPLPLPFGLLLTGLAGLGVLGRQRAKQS